MANDKAYLFGRKEDTSIDYNDIQKDEMITQLEQRKTPNVGI